MSRRALIVGLVILLVAGGVFAAAFAKDRPEPVYGGARPPGRDIPAAKSLELADDPGENQEWYTETRVGEGAQVPVEELVRARTLVLARLASAQRRTGTGGAGAAAGGGAPGASRPVAARKHWTFMGPGNVGGRTRALVVDPSNPRVLYTGGVSGGVWKSTTGGSSWTPLTDTFSNVAVSALAMDPSDHSVIYVATGELANSREEPTRGIGVLKTMDGGASWVILPSTRDDDDFTVVADLAVSPNDPRRLYAATTSGVLVSANGGATWDLTLPGRTRAGCNDLTLRTDRNPDVVFANCSMVAPNGVYRSTDGGLHWNKLLETVFGGGIGFTAVAIAPSDQDVVYASVSEGLDPDDPEAYTGRAVALLRSDRGGDNGTWQVVNVPTGQPGSPRWLSWCGGDEGQGSYANAIAVDPTDPKRIWLGGIDGFRSDDGGRTIRIAAYWWGKHHGFGNGTPYVHADYHQIVFAPNYDGSANRTVYFVTDGGLFRTDDDRVPLTRDSCRPDQPLGSLNQVAYTSLNNGYGVTQFWGGAVSDDGRFLLGGTQDNGTYLLRVGDGINGWTFAHWGDGMRTAITPDASTFYAETPGDRGIAIARSRTAEFGSFEVVSNFGDEGLFVTPYVLDPNDPDVLWTGGHVMWRSTNGGDTWLQSSPELVPLPPENVPGIVSAIAVAPGDSDVVYVGTASGNVFRTKNGGAKPPKWQEVTGPMPSGDLGFVSWIEVDPRNPDVAWVAHSHFGVGHVWKTSDGGQTWMNVDRGLPDVPVSAIAANPLDPRMVYAGTDIGVFESLDGGLSWLVANDDLVSTIVQQLVFRRGTSQLYAFTYGRGVYMVDVGPGR